MSTLTSLRVRGPSCRMAAVATNTSSSSRPYSWLLMLETLVKSLEVEGGLLNATPLPPLVGSSPPLTVPSESSELSWNTGVDVASGGGTVD